MAATRDQLLASGARTFGEFTLPVSKLTVRFRSLREAEIAAYELEEWKRDDSGRVQFDRDAESLERSRLMVLCLVDDEGKLLFDADDAARLSESMDGADSRALFGVLKGFTGIGELDRSLEKKEAEKKSDPPSSPAMSA